MPNTGTSESTAISAMMVAANPASPNFRISSESENCRAMNEMPAVPWVSTQAGPTTSTALVKAVSLSWPAIRRSRAAKVSCIESEKLITMMSGVITFRNMLRLKPAQPRLPSASRIAMIGGNAATTMNDILRKKMIAMMQPARMPRML